VTFATARAAKWWEKFCGLLDKGGEYGHNKRVSAFPHNPVMKLIKFFDETISWSFIPIERISSQGYN
jgi:hypothetical protein